MHARSGPWTGGMRRCLLVGLCAIVAASTFAACGGSGGSSEADGAEEAFDAFWEAAFAGDGAAACARLLPDLQDSLVVVGPLFGVGESASCPELVLAWADDLRAGNGGSDPEVDLADIEVRRPVGELPEFVDEEVELFAAGDAVVGGAPPSSMQLLLVGGEWLIATPPGPFPEE